MASKTDRRSLYQEVTDQIISELEAGRVPWVQPWGTPDAKASLGLPKNAKTHRNYSGVNILILWGAVIRKGYSCQHWLTFRQALDLGGSVRKGERGTVACYADRFIPRAERERAARVRRRAGSCAVPQAFHPVQRRPVRRSCLTAPMSGAVPLARAGDRPPSRSLDRSDRRRSSGSAATRACYAPSGDFILMPPQQAFFDQVNFFAVCLHELTHWVGQPPRA